MDLVKKKRNAEFMREFSVGARSCTFLLIDLPRKHRIKNAHYNVRAKRLIVNLCTAQHSKSLAYDGN